MKIIHTADWHLGKNLGSFSLLEAQKHALNQLISYCETEQPDAVLIAGDIFDRNVPPSDAVALFSQTISKIVNDLQIAVLAIAGNHDSSERIHYGADIFAKNRFYIIGKPNFPIQPVVIKDEFGEVAFYLFPYCEPEFFNFLLKEDQISVQNHQVVFEQIASQVPKGQRAVLVAHAFVRGGSVSESERNLGVGGAEMVSSDVFEPFIYTALGHLHQRQTHQNSHYSGSLLKYSVSELHHNKSFSLVELTENNFSIRYLPIKPLRELVICQACVSSNGIDILDKKPNIEDFIFFKLSNTEPVPNIMSVLQKQYPFTVGLEWSEFEATGNLQSLSAQEVRSMDEIALIESFYRSLTTEPLSEYQQASLKEIINQLTT